LLQNGQPLARQKKRGPVGRIFINHLVSRLYRKQDRRALLGVGRFGDVGRNEYLYDAMKKVRITAIRQTVYRDLMERYENPIEHTCDVREGDSWVSIDGQRPDGLCPSAWDSMSQFVQALARGEGNFYDGWMRNPNSAMISCNDGFRPFSFYIETID